MSLRTVYVQPLQTIIAIIIVAIIVWISLGACIKKHRDMWCTVNGILAFISLVAILYTTIIKRDASSSQTMPFVRTVEHIKAQPELIREMVMNSFLFFPFGLTAPFALTNCMNETNGRRIVLITIISAFFLSCIIELIQFLFNFGNAELSDIICNTMGAAIGTVSYLVSRKINIGRLK